MVKQAGEQKTVAAVNIFSTTNSHHIGWTKFHSAFFLLFSTFLFVQKSLLLGTQISTGFRIHTGDKPRSHRKS